MSNARLAAIALLLALVAAGAWNAVSPRGVSNTGAIDPAEGPAAVPVDRIDDRAEMLWVYASRLEWEASAWLDDFGIDFRIVTVAEAGTPVEDLALQIFHDRRVGADAPTGGLLLLLNRARREARIEVSYPLEAIYPDGLLGQLARQQLVPYASYRAAGMAVSDVLHFLRDYTILKVLRGELLLDAAYRERESFRSRSEFLSGGGGAQVKLAAIPVDRELKARVPDSERARYQPSSDPMQSAEAFLRVRLDLAGDPTLELFTPGSRIMRARYPVAPFEELEHLHRAEASRPLRVTARGDRAVVLSDTPATGFVPILLQREQGLWRVDLVETWKNLFFGRDGNYRQVNSHNPYAFGLAGHGRGGVEDIAALDLGGRDLAAVIGELELRDESLDHFLLAELLFRNCFVAVEALRHYQRAVELASQNPLFRRTLGDRASYLGFWELAASAYRPLVSQAQVPAIPAGSSASTLEMAAVSLRRALAHHAEQPGAATRELLLERGLLSE